MKSRIASFMKEGKGKLPMASSPSAASLKSAGSGGDSPTNNNTQVFEILDQV